MRKYYFLPFILLSIVTSYAEEKLVIQVQQLNRDFNADRMKMKNVQVNKVSHLDQNKILSPEVRDDLFLKSGLMSSVQSWDNLDRDILVIRVKNLQADKLKSKYPKLKMKNLLKLKKLLKEA